VKVIPSTGVGMNEVASGAIGCGGGGGGEFSIIRIS
jgi:hypothetical protein